MKVFPSKKVMQSKTIFYLWGPGTLRLALKGYLTDPLGGRQPYQQSPKRPTMNFCGLNERSW